MADGCQHPKLKEVRTDDLSGPQRSHGRGTAPQSSSRRGRQPPPGPQHHGKEKQRETAQLLSAPILHLILVPSTGHAQAAARGIRGPKRSLPGVQIRAEKTVLHGKLGVWEKKQRLASYSGSLPIAPLFHPPSPPGLRRL